MQSLVQIGTANSEKIQFEFLYLHDLGPRSRNDLDIQYSHILIHSISCADVHDLGPKSKNDLDLQYSHSFMKSISCLHLPTFRSQASIVSEKSTVFTFSHTKA